MAPWPPAVPLRAGSDCRPAEQHQRDKTMKHWMPLAGFVVPTTVIGYGFMIPHSCIAGVNELSLGFGAAIAAGCVSYILGVRAALKSTAERFTQT